MYEFKHRFIRGSFIPIIFTIQFLVQIVLNTSNPSQWNTFLFVNILLTVVYSILGYLASVFFFSLEGLIKSFMSNQASFIQELNAIRHRSILKSLQITEQNDLKLSYQITSSIIFQTILILIAVYISATHGTFMGQIILMSILFQMLFEQGLRLTRGSDLNHWYWQVSKTLNRNTQALIYLSMLIIYVWALSNMLFR